MCGQLAPFNFVGILVIDFSRPTLVGRKIAWTTRYACFGAIDDHDVSIGYAAGQVSIVLGQLGTDAVALGASTLVVEELLARGGQAPEVRRAHSAVARSGI